MSENNGGYYCVNCLHSFRSTNKLELHEDVCKDHVYYHIKMSGEYSNILKFNQEQKVLRILFVFYADTESLLKKIQYNRNLTQ